MSISRGRWVASGLLRTGALFLAGLSTAGAQAVPEDAPPLEGPRSSADPAPARVQNVAPGGPIHEALLAPDRSVAGQRVPKPPPPPLAERSAPDRPSADSQWVAGYWAWNPARNDFDWVAGSWQLPPPGAIWVSGHWMRDADGWYRTAGFWSQRRDAKVAAAAAGRADWHLTGPPADRPADVPGPAPGADFFYVPGQYVPKEDRLVWTPGFWSRNRAGWDWVPARWVRLPQAWAFRQGYWTREPNLGPAEPAEGPDAVSSLPPAIVESEPAAPAARPEQRPFAVPDPIAEAEQNPRALNPAAGAELSVTVVPGAGPYLPPPVFAGPPRGYVYGVPVRVIRPPGTFPYGPAGVVVPAAVPPFVQRLLDRVLP